MKFRRGEKRLNMEKLYPSRQLPRSSYLRVTPFSSGGNSRRPSSSNHYSRSFKIMDFWSNYLAGGDGRCQEVPWENPLSFAPRYCYARNFSARFHNLDESFAQVLWGWGTRTERDEILSFPTPINFRFGNGFKLEYHTFDISWRMFQLSVHCFPLWIFWLMGGARGEVGVISWGGDFVFLFTPIWKLPRWIGVNYGRVWRTRDEKESEWSGILWE